VFLSLEISTEYISSYLSEIDTLDVVKVSLGLVDDEVDGPKILHGRNADLTYTEFLNPDSFRPLVCTYRGQ
jgi:hypothetical protein